MGLYIKGLEMPKKGEHIIALIKNDGKVSYFEQDTETTTCKRMKEAEAIKIPTPHGKIIEVGKIQSKIENQLKGEEITWYQLREVRRYIHDAPTILEAEEK